RPAKIGPAKIHATTARCASRGSDRTSTERVTEPGPSGSSRTRLLRRRGADLAAGEQEGGAARRAGNEGGLHTEPGPEHRMNGAIRRLEAGSDRLPARRGAAHHPLAQERGGKQQETPVAKVADLQAGAVELGGERGSAIAADVAGGRVVGAEEPGTGGH